MPSLPTGVDDETNPSFVPDSDGVMRLSAHSAAEWNDLERLMQMCNKHNIRSVHWQGTTIEHNTERVFHEVNAPFLVRLAVSLTDLLAKLFSEIAAMVALGGADENDKTQN